MESPASTLFVWKTHTSELSILIRSQQTRHTGKIVSQSGDYGGYFLLPVISSIDGQEKNEGDVAAARWLIDSSSPHAKSRPPNYSFHWLTPDKREIALLRAAINRIFYTSTHKAVLPDKGILFTRNLLATKLLVLSCSIQVCVALVQSISVCWLLAR